MNFEEYQKLSRRTVIYPDAGNNFIYPTLGLTGEAGEVAERIKRVLRDDKGIVSKEKKQEILKELGDVLWYLAQIATELDLSLDKIASVNIEKLASRKERDTLSGNAEDR